MTLDLFIEAIDTTVTSNWPNLMANGTGLAYQWLDCNNNFAPISGATNQSFTPGSSGSYAVSLGGNFCVDTSACHQVFLTSANDGEPDLFPSIFPNPTSGKILISFPREHKNVTISLSNMLGQILTEQFFPEIREAQFSIEGATGVYFLSIKDDAELFMVEKIVKRE